MDACWLFSILCMFEIFLNWRKKWQQTFLQTKVTEYVHLWGLVKWDASLRILEKQQRLLVMEEGSGERGGRRKADREYLPTWPTAGWSCRPRSIIISARKKHISESSNVWVNLYNPFIQIDCRSWKGTQRSSTLAPSFSSQKNEAQRSYTVKKRQGILKKDIGI